MSLGDVPAVARLLLDSPEAAGWSEQAIGSSLEHAATLALVGEHTGQLVGLVIGTKVADEGEILNLAVRLSHRRMGLGKLLVEALVAQWQNQGAAKIFLEVRVSNAAAINLYQSLGFREIGRRTRYYSGPAEDALVLGKTCSE